MILFRHKLTRSRAVFHCLPKE